MCFSATASFVTSGALLGGSVLAFRELKGNRYALFALIPFLFAIQQAIEGFSWLAIQQGSPNYILAYGFLFFAFLLWPIYLPLAALRIEQEKWRRKILWLFFGLGVFTSLALAAHLINYPLTVEISGRSLVYNIYSPFYLLLAITYLFATCGSGLIVNRFWIQMFGAMTLLGALISAIIFSEAFTSVWCFFAALLSLFVILELKSVRRR